jgi:cytochrome c5
MKIYSALLVSLLMSLSLAGGNAQALDGEQLYNSNCSSCHGTEVFTRPNRRVKNMAELTSRVRQCSYATEVKWFDEEVNAVSSYLNQSFYKF